MWLPLKNKRKKKTEEKKRKVIDNVVLFKLPLYNLTTPNIVIKRNMDWMHKQTETQ